MDEGRITRICVGPMRHTGTRDYYDRHHWLPDGRNYREATVDTFRQILSGEVSPSGSGP